ncbi:MAG: hypothetical protein RLY85_1258 [Bacteroidota bacterium]
MTGIFLCTTMISMAQKQSGPQQQVLQKIAADQYLRETESYERALKLAAQKGWSLSFKDDKGNTAKLVGVDDKGFPMYVATQSNLVAATTIGTSKLWSGGSSGLNLNGSNILLLNKLGIWDGGQINQTHVEFNNRITPKDNAVAVDPHATHVAGTLIASGVNPTAKGMANGIRGIWAYDFSNHLAEMAVASPSLLVSNHSYGSISGWRYNQSQSRWEFWGAPGAIEDWKFGAYTNEAALWDSIAYFAPNYLIVKSSGNNRNEKGPTLGTTYWRQNESNQWINAGARGADISDQSEFDLLPTYSTAKNILTVGNVALVPGGYTRPEDVLLASSSSVGPTDDGRIKPDVVAPGSGITSTSTGSNSSYATLSGTSMSSPTVAGSAILLQELFMSKFNNRSAWSSTIKGLIIHTADKASTVPGPNYLHGWGLANIAKAAGVLNNSANNLVTEQNLKNDSSFTISVVASGKGPLAATLCWTDPAGTIATTGAVDDITRRLVNDLDIRITQGNKTFLPWKLNGMNPLNPATRGDNVIDNVEKVEVDSVMLGETYTITVRHKGKFIYGDSTQSFSLVVSGIGGNAYAASAPTSGAGAYIDSLSFGGIRMKFKDTCKTYSDSRYLTGAIESGGTDSLALRVKSCDNTNNMRYAKIFMDLNSDGDFTDAGELIATSSALFNDSLFKAPVILPNGFSIGDKLLMRVIVMETTDPAAILPSGSYSKGETQDYTLQIALPSQDLGINELLYPYGGECSDGAQYVTIELKNSGTKAVRNIPLTVDIKENGNPIKTINGVFNGPLPAGSSTEYTFQTPFVMKESTRYTFDIKSTLATDQNADNNAIITEVSATGPGAPLTSLQALICNNSAALLKGPITEGNYISWYNADTASSPFATTANNIVANTPVITADKKYYAARNNLSGSVGPKDKLVFPSGGYNQFSGNFVRFSNTVPMLIESVKMYTANPGKIKIIFADIANEPGDGSYSYYIRDEKTFLVTNSRPTAQGGALNENDPNDKGMVFNLNFAAFEPGNHILIMQCSEGATVYRSNGITTTPYPQKIDGVNNGFTITGNSVVPSSSSDPSQFYYFFYDMKVSLLAETCPSPKVAVTAINNTIPTITRNGDTLTSSMASGNQWQLNGVDIPGERNQKIKVTQSGKYRTIVQDDFRCQSISAEQDVTVTAIINVAPERIGFSVAPNPNNGSFLLTFSVSGREDLAISLLNTSGQEVYRQSKARFSGTFKENIRLNKVQPGVYMIKITHGLNQYMKRMVVL